MIEYATPLPNMYDMSEEAVQVSGFTFTPADREEQVNEFYNTLRRLLEKDLNCSKKYDLVLMGPSDDFVSGDGKLGDILCDKVFSK